MIAPPIPMAFDGEAFRPLPNFLRVAREHYGAGEIVALIPHEERSIKSHNHFFVLVGEAWKNLPDHLASQFPTPDSLRKRALIRTGHCDAETFVCKFKTEAVRLAAALRSTPDAVVVIDGKVVTRLTAQSQSLRAMGKETFQRSKDDVLGFLAEMIGVEPAQLARAA